MTEQEWLNAKTTAEMWERAALSDNLSRRKLRLFAVACCQPFSHLLEDERCRKALEVAERFADGLASEEERETANQEAYAALDYTAERPVAFYAAADAVKLVNRVDSIREAEYLVEQVSHLAATVAVPSDDRDAYKAAWFEALAGPADLLREIVGNPFRPLASSPPWLTERVRILARSIYDKRAFERLPELAGALKEAGCDSADVLQHCRIPGDHVRGCWVVDFLVADGPAGNDLMSEKEWLQYTKPQPMLDWLTGRASDRKLRLFACACCRRIWSMLKDVRSRCAVEVAERFADGVASEQERAAAQEAAEEAVQAAQAVFSATILARSDAEMWANNAPSCAAEAARAAVDIHESYSMIAVHRAAYGMRLGPGVNSGLAYCAEKAAQAELLRDIFGNPVQPTAVPESGLTLRVVGIARSIYDERAFERMPMLANALEAAGCKDADILSHCRGPGSHVRGCWVVDLLIGKT